MSAEVGIGFGIKLFGGAAMAFITGAVGHLYWMIRKDKTKLDQTLTKEETEQLVDLKLEPTKTKVETIFDLLHSMNENSQTTAEGIQDIGKNVAVLKNDMEHVKEDIKELKRNKKDK